VPPKKKANLQHGIPNAQEPCRRAAARRKATDFTGSMNPQEKSRLSNRASPGYLKYIKQEEYDYYSKPKWSELLWMT